MGEWKERMRQCSPLEMVNSVYELNVVDCVNVKGWEKGIFGIL